MDINSVGIPLAFVILASITLWFIILGKGYWYIKAFVVALTLYFSFGMWASLSNLSGWPSEQQLPEKFVLHWALVKEPSKTDITQTGSILLWASEKFDEDEETVNTILPFVKVKRNTSPRVYKLPYSEEMHEKLSKAMKQLTQGKGVMGGKGDAEGKEGGEKGLGKDGKGKRGKGYGSLSQEQDYIFYDLPPPVMPSKD